MWFAGGKYEEKKNTHTTQQPRDTFFGGVQFVREHFDEIDTLYIVWWIWGIDLFYLRLQTSEWQEIGMGRESEKKKRCLIISPFKHVHSWHLWGLSLSCREYD